MCCFAATHGKMPDTPCTVDEVWQDDEAARPEVGIDAGLLDGVECREVVRNRQSGSSRHLQERIAEVASARKAARIEGGFKRPVTGEQIETAGAVRRRPLGSWAPPEPSA
jgi:hypothetical protein